MTRLIVTTGGTGGHIFPALAVADAVRRLAPEAEVYFVGGTGPEGALAAKAGLPFVGLPARGVFGRGLRALAAPFWMAKAFGQAVRLLGRLRPDVVAGFGGYAGFIPVVAARLMGIPTAIHEQNSVPGMTNRLLGRLVDRVCITYPDTSHAFAVGKTVRLGNPIRGDIAAGIAPRVAGRRHLLVLGGSQGARAVNDAVLDMLPRLFDAGITVRLQAGQADFERAGARAAELLRHRGPRPEGPELVIENFIEDMAEAYGWSDLVLARAGASTLAEVTAAGRPSVLIPFPYATHDHQTVNAAFLAATGAALVLPQASLAERDLAVVIKGLFADEARLSVMAAAAGAQAMPLAAERIAGELLALRARKGGRR